MKTWHDGYHLFPDSMLFDLENDPHEQINLAPTLPIICQQAETYLTEWLSTMEALGPTGYGDPMVTVLNEGGPFHARGMLPAYLQRLKETGRSWAVDELIAKHPGEFTNVETKS